MTLVSKSNLNAFSSKKRSLKYKALYSKKKLNCSKHCYTCRINVGKLVTQTGCRCHTRRLEWVENCYTYHCIGCRLGTRGCKCGGSEWRTARWRRSSWWPSTGKPQSGVAVDYTYPSAVHHSTSGCTSAFATTKHATAASRGPHAVESPYASTSL